MAAKAETGTIGAAVRTAYPTRYPLEALEDIRRIGKCNTWLMDRAVLGRAIWEVHGMAQRICIGDPDDQRIEDAPIDPQQLADLLYQTRDLVLKGIQVMRATATHANLSGDALAERDQQTAVRAVEALLGSVLIALAWLRKMALEQVGKEIRR
jgi:hypothetical protein